MGANSITSPSSFTAATETDLYNNETAQKTITLGIDIYNPESTAQAVEIWKTSAANAHIGTPIFKGNIAALTPISNVRKYVILPGQKIRFKSASANVTIEMSIFEGLA